MLKEILNKVKFCGKMKNLEIPRVGNEKGVFWLIIGFFIIILILPAFVMMVFPPADWIMRIILVFVIYSTVRGMLGSGIISLLISAILIYIVVIKHAYAAASIYVFFFVLMGIGFLSVIIWGTSTLLRKH